MIPCTIRQLEVFVAAAEMGHFGRTAGALGISQPAVTKQIATLERQIGMTLFVRRRGSTPILSREGTAFLDQARRFLSEGENINAHCRNADASKANSVRIACGVQILNRVIKPWLPQFMRAHPAFAVNCTVVETTSQGFDLLAAGSADLLFTVVARSVETNFPGEPLFPVPVSIYAGRGYLDRRSASPAEISAMPFLLPGAGSESERIVLDALADVGVAPTTVAMRAQYSDVLRELAIDGSGVVALFDETAARAVEAGDLFAFDLKLSPMYKTLFRRERTAGPAVAAVEESLRASLRF